MGVLLRTKAIKIFITATTIGEILVIVVMGTTVYIWSLSLALQGDLLHFFCLKIYLVMGTKLCVCVCVFWSIPCSHCHLLLWYYFALSIKGLTQHESLSELFNELCLSQWTTRHRTSSLLRCVMGVDRQASVFMSEAGATFNFDNCTQMFPSSIPCFILQVVSLLHGNKWGEINGCSLHFTVTS